MTIRCPKCGEHCEIDIEPVVGQHIICPFCLVKFSYGETQADADRIEQSGTSSRTIMAVCPYCGFAEPVDEHYSGRVGECSQCHGEFTIMPNAKGIPFQPQSADGMQSSRQEYRSSAEGVLSFLLGLILGIFGVLLAVLIDKKKYLKASLWGLVVNLIVGVIGAAILVSITATTGDSSRIPTISVDLGNVSEEEKELAEEEVKVFTKMSREIGRKAAGASSALSGDEGSNARRRADAISRDRVRRLGE